MITQPLSLFVIVLILIIIVNIIYIKFSFRKKVTNEVFRLKNIQDEDLEKLKSEINRLSYIIKTYKKQINDFQSNDELINTQVSQKIKIESEENFKSLAIEKSNLEKEKQKLEQKNKKLWEQSLAIHKEKERINIIKEETEAKQKDIREQNIILGKQTQKLIELDKSKSQFFANISHEFRTPLTLIKGNLESIFKEEINDSIKRKLSIIEHNSQSLLYLINQLLDLSKAEEGKLKLSYVERDIIFDIKHLVTSFNFQASKNGIKFSINSEIDELYMKYDLEKLEIILKNLLSNAIKFTPKKGEISLSISKSESNKSTKKPLLIIKIQDTGIGIAKENFNMIFDRFYQVDATLKKEYEGTGIGLALTKELVELHKGKIYVTSKIGQGTTFSVNLPIDSSLIKSTLKQNIISTHNTDSTIRILDTSHSKNKIDDENDINKKTLPTILIVEDNSDLRGYLKEILMDGYQIKIAKNGIEGLETAKKLSPDLIISDIMMPKMNGIELSEHLKTNELTSHIPIILLTAKTGIDSKIEGLETGADDYLTKPFYQNELIVRVKNLILQRKKLRELFSKKPNISTKEISINATDEKFLEKAIKTIEENMQNNEFNTNSFAKEMAISRSQLHKKLTALTNQSATEFNRSIRLKKAAYLLKRGKGNISEVCYDVGFSNLSYFSKCFTKMYKISPSQYQEKELYLN